MIQELKRVEIESFLGFHYVSGPVFSPSGNHAAFYMKRPCLHENRYESDIHLFDVKTRRTYPLTSGGDASMFCWADEETLLFSSMRSGKQKELFQFDKDFAVFYEISLSGGEAREAFTLPIPVRGIRKVSDGLFLLNTFLHAGRTEFYHKSLEERAGLAKEYTEESCYVIEDQPFWTDNVGITSGRRAGLYLYDRNTGSLTPVTGPLFHVTESDCDCKRILFAGAEYASAKPKLAGLYVYDIAHGVTKCLVEPATREVGVVALWDERAVFASNASDIDMDSRVYCDFFAADIPSGKIELLAPFEHYIGRGTVNSDARLGDGKGFKRHRDKLYFVTTIGHDTCLYSMDHSGKIGAPLTPAGSCDNFDVFGETILYCGMYNNRLVELYFGGERVTAFNDGYTRSHSVATPEPVAVNTSDGFKLEGWIMRPIGFDPNQTYPAIFHIHGGPCTAFGCLYHHEMQVWANHGYAVIYCNPRGSDGRGEAFANIRGQYGTVDYTGLMEFLDAVLAQYKEIDVSRVGVTGGSYGGFMTNWIIGHTDRFKCAVSQRSISNWINMEHTSDIGVYFSPREQGATTANNAEKLWWHSPLKYAGHVKTPTLFLQSDADYRCWMADALSMYTAIRHRGVESRLCLFKGESHELSRSGRPKSRIRRMQEIIDWFDKYLKGSHPEGRIKSDRE